MDPERADYADLERQPIRLPPAWLLELGAAILLLAVGLPIPYLADWLNALWH